MNAADTLTTVFAAPFIGSPIGCATGLPAQQLEHPEIAACALWGAEFPGPVIESLKQDRSLMVASLEETHNIILLRQTAPCESPKPAAS